jgi:hypothetical protein
MQSVADRIAELRRTKKRSSQSIANKPEHSGLGMTTLANLYCYEENENSVTTPGVVPAPATQL